MWAVGAVGEVGTLLWVVNAVKAQNHTKQEGAPPSADPRGVGGYIHAYTCTLRHTHTHMCIHTYLCIIIHFIVRRFALAW